VVAVVVEGCLGAFGDGCSEVLESGLVLVL
jgi:hypothetical protein